MGGRITQGLVTKAYYVRLIHRVVCAFLMRAGKRMVARRVSSFLLSR